MFAVVHRQSYRWLPGHDPYLLPIAAIFSGWGILTIWRLFPALGMRQMIWLVITLLVLIAAFRLPNDLGFLRRYKYLWLTGGIILTFLTLILGINPLGYGPRLWLGGFGVYFQPSEPLKLLLIIYLAAYLADRQPFAPGLVPLLAPTLIMIGLVVTLLLIQRDLGTSTIFLFLYVVVVYIASGRKLILLVGLATLLLAGVLGYALFDVVHLRIDAWINPWLDPSGRSYQIVQSLMAVASGGLFGRGPGLGNPGLVPIPHSDFIFVSLAEEGGLLGAFALFILLGLFISRGIQIAIYAQDAFRRYLAAGITALLVAQSILIIAGNLRLFPLTGVTLPFLSYGGTSLLTSFLGLVLLLHISNQEKSDVSVIDAFPRLKEAQFHSRNYLYLGGLLLAALAALALTHGWWAFYRGTNLLTRTDNPRRAIGDRYVRRGALLDRHNDPISTTTGQPGKLTREYLVPDLSPIAGYTHPVYGQSGLEASLDEYLRGIKGNPEISVWWNQLLYVQPPPGLDIRLTLDKSIQDIADSLLGNTKGALVLMNAQNGEILAIASHPTFNANDLDQDWSKLVEDADAPLFNRALLGRYPAETALGPLYLAEAISAGIPLEELSLSPESPVNEDASVTQECALKVQKETLEGMIAAGCTRAVRTLEEALNSLPGENIISQLGTDLFSLAVNSTMGLQFPDLPPGQKDSSPYPGGVSSLQTSQKSGLSLSPLQMALSSAVLTTGGTRPVPGLVMAINMPEAGWTLPAGASTFTQILPRSAAETVTRALVVKDIPIWQSLAMAPAGNNQRFTWYIAGTLPDWQGAPLALALLLEKDDPQAALKIGQEIIRYALSPDSQ